MPFDVTRAFSTKLPQYRDPRNLDRQRDKEMWETLES